MRRSYDRLISTMGFPILVRWHLYIESGPSPHRCLWWSRPWQTCSPLRHSDAPCQTHPVNRTSLVLSVAEDGNAWPWAKDQLCSSPTCSADPTNTSVLLISEKHGRKNNWLPYIWYNYVNRLHFVHDVTGVLKLNKLSLSWHFKWSTMANGNVYWIIAWTITWKMIISSGHMFVHVTTVQLSWRVQPVAWSNNQNRN